MDVTRAGENITKDNKKGRERGRRSVWRLKVLGGRRGGGGDETEVPVGLRMRAVREAVRRVMGLWRESRKVVVMAKRGVRIARDDDGVRMVEEESSTTMRIGVSMMIVGRGMSLEELEVDGGMGLRAVLDEGL